jgi:hypothetical protein
MSEIEQRSADTPKPMSEPLADVNADLTQRVVVDTRGMTWEPSPSGTVWRKPLYRHGGEHGPVTSLVRYAPGGVFRAHAHPEGEEILVLEGELCDEHGRYPEGTWIRSPHMSQHTPLLRAGLPDLRAGGRALRRARGCQSRCGGIRATTEHPRRRATAIGANAGTTPGTRPR